jgi:hypothetical protein
MNFSNPSDLRPDEPQHTYDEHYYKNYLSDSGLPYERADLWLNFFAHIADKIIEHIQPHTVLDVGCAKGFLVEALRDRGVEAFGLDILNTPLARSEKISSPFAGSARQPMPWRAATTLSSASKSSNI